MAMGTSLIFLGIALPWLGALLVWWAGDRRPKVQHTLAVLFAVAAGLAMTTLLLTGFAGGSEPSLSFFKGTAQENTPFGVFSFSPDGLGVFLAVVATVVGSLAVIFSVDYMRGEAQLGRYYALVLFFIGAMVGLVLTTNLLLVFVFW